MRSLLLPALLLTAPVAQAQTPASTPPAGTVTLRLTAAPGSGVELLTTTRTQMTLEDVQASGPGGKVLSTAELNKLRAEMQRGMGAAAQTLSGKTFYKVQGRAADGTVTLLTSTALTVPGQPALTVRLVQTVGPGGKAQITRVESDNPQLQAVLGKLSPEALSAQVSGGGDPTGLYGQSFTAGQPRSQTVTLDAQALLGSVLGSLTSGMGGADVLGKIKATPLTVQTTTTYQGVNARGQTVFNLRSTARPWTVELAGLGDKASPMGMKLELLDLAQSGQSTYRPDGLPAAQTSTQTMRMRMTIETQGGGRMQMLLRMNQTTTAGSR